MSKATNWTSKNTSYISFPLGKQHKIFATWKNGGLHNEAHLDSKPKMHHHSNELIPTRCSN
jgi:hypothetical protein